MRPQLKYRKAKSTKRENRYEPYDWDEEIIVPENRKYLTPSQVKEAQLRFERNESCRICGDIFDGECRSVIDHCHVTGVIRGKLCYRCNIALGLFKDKIYVVQSALDYLTHFKYNADMVDQNLWGDWFGLNDPRNVKGEISE